MTKKIDLAEKPELTESEWKMLDEMLKEMSPEERKIELERLYRESVKRQEERGNG